MVSILNWSTKCRCKKDCFELKLLFFSFPSFLIKIYFSFVFLAFISFYHNVIGSYRLHATKLLQIQLQVIRSCVSYIPFWKIFESEKVIAYVFLVSQTSYLGALKFFLNCCPNLSYKNTYAQNWANITAYWPKLPKNKLNNST